MYLEAIWLYYGRERANAAVSQLALQGLAGANYDLITSLLAIEFGGGEEVIDRYAERYVREELTELTVFLAIKRRRLEEAFDTLIAAMPNLKEPALSRCVARMLRASEEGGRIDLFREIVDHLAASSPKTWVDARAHVRLLEGDYLGALELLSSEDESSPGPAERHLDKAYCYGRLARYAEAIECVNAVLPSSRAYCESLQLKADILVQMKDFGRAEGALLELLGIRPSETDALKMLVRVQARQLKLREALRSTYKLIDETRRIAALSPPLC
ncbi:MAG: hypothetical protein ABL949_09720 [Fimbriimonadaceae bacterium]